jgi:hypothetical protein
MRLGVGIPSEMGGSRLLGDGMASPILWAYSLTAAAHPGGVS